MTPLTAMTLLNQRVSWKVANTDFLSKFLAFSEIVQSRFSLALDGVADITPGSDFAHVLTPEELTLANAVYTADANIEERWPGLVPLLSRVCAPSYSYENVVAALEKEATNDPMVHYLRDITYN